jgi:hypothetical protein
LRSGKCSSSGEISGITSTVSAKFVCSLGDAQNRKKSMMKDLNKPKGFMHVSGRKFKKNALARFVMIGLIASLASCSRTLYVPNSLNMPLFAESKDFKGAVNYRVVAPPNLDFQAAFAPVNHLAVMGNASFAGFSSSQSQTEAKYALGELGIGGFTAFWEDECKVKMARLEMFGGYGIGNSLVVDDVQELFFPDPTIRRFEGRFTRAFLQPAIGLKTSYVDLALATRFSKVEFDRFANYENGVLTDEGSYQFYTMEPVIAIGIGYRGFKLTTQFGNVKPLGGGDSDYFKAVGDTWANIHFHVGFAFGNMGEDCPSPSPAISLQQDQNNAKYPPPPTILHLRQATLNICLQDGGVPDGDVVSVSLNGAYLVKEAKLGRKPQCFEAVLNDAAENILRIQSISNGERNPNTLKLVFREGRKRHAYYLLTEVGRTEEIRLVVEE